MEQELSKALGTREIEAGFNEVLERIGKEFASMWDDGFVSRVLRDERYTGKHIYGKRRRAELGNPNTVAAPSSEWIVVPDVIPPIISAEQFARVKALREEKATGMSGRIAHSSPSLFSRKLFCGGCGKALIRVKRGERNYYYCSTSSMKPGLGCMRGSIRESVVIGTVLTVLRQQAMLADGIMANQKAGAKAAVSETERLRGEVRGLKRLTEKVGSDKLTLWEKHNAGQLSREAFQNQSDALNRQLSESAKRIAELDSQIRGHELESGREDVFVERFSKQTGIRELTPEVVHEFIRSIRVYAPDRMEIMLNYADENERLREQMGS